MHPCVNLITTRLTWRSVCPPWRHQSQPEQGAEPHMTVVSAISSFRTNLHSCAHIIRAGHKSDLGVL
jgi:hypothetical protein